MSIILTVIQKTKKPKLTVYIHTYSTQRKCVSAVRISTINGLLGEVTELADVPMAYSKKAPVVSQVKLKRESGKILPLVQSIDWHQSLGAFQFFINKTADGGKINPTWQSEYGVTVVTLMIHLLKLT